MVVFSLRDYHYYWLTLYFHFPHSSVNLLYFIRSWWPPFCILFYFLFYSSFFHLHFLAFVAGFLPFSVLVIFSFVSSLSLSCLYILRTYKAWLFMIVTRITHLFLLAWAAKTENWSLDIIHCCRYLGIALGFFFRSPLSAFVVGYFFWSYLLCCLLAFTPLYFVFSFLFSPTESSLFRFSRYSSSRNILG